MGRQLPVVHDPGSVVPYQTHLRRVSVPLAPVEVGGVILGLRTTHGAYGSRNRIGRDSGPKGEGTASSVSGSLGGGRSSTVLDFQMTVKSGLFLSSGLWTMFL